MGGGNSESEDASIPKVITAPSTEVWSECLGREVAPPVSKGAASSRGVGHDTSFRRAEVSLPSQDVAIVDVDEIPSTSEDTQQSTGDQVYLGNSSAASVEGMNEEVEVNDEFNYTATNLWFDVWNSAEMRYAAADVQYNERCVEYARRWWSRLCPIDVRTEVGFDQLRTLLLYISRPPIVDFLPSSSEMSRGWFEDHNETQQDGETEASQ
ncbi:hypothetical protein Aperf_G00000122932 [Anoplocephala perfoliata]